MNRFIIAILVLLSAFFSTLTNLPSAKAALTREFLVIYTGNLLAELKPCGCAKKENKVGLNAACIPARNPKR
jgi:hypothetical protein